MNGVAAVNLHEIILKLNKSDINLHENRLTIAIKHEYFLRFFFFRVSLSVIFYSAPVGWCRRRHTVTHFLLVLFISIIFYCYENVCLYAGVRARVRLYN